MVFSRDRNSLVRIARIKFMYRKDWRVALVSGAHHRRGLVDGVEADESLGAVLSEVLVPGVLALQPDTARVGVFVQ